jgi:hypothetical protein
MGGDTDIMYKKIECFRLEESPYHPGKWKIVPVHENFHIDGLPNGGSCNIICARLMNLTYAQYLRFCRDVLGAEIIGKNTTYPIAYFQRGGVLQQFLRLLNNRANLVLWERAHPDYEVHQDYVVKKAAQNDIEKGMLTNVDNQGNS